MKLKKRHLANSTFMVGLQKAEIKCISPNGEVLWVLGLSEGQHYSDHFRSIMTNDDYLEIDGVISLVKHSTGRVTAQSMGSVAAESGANPDWRPDQTLASQRKLDATLNAVTKKARQIENKLASLQRLAESAAVNEVIEETPPAPVAAVEPEPEAATDTVATGSDETPET